VDRIYTQWTGSTHNIDQSRPTQNGLTGNLKNGLTDNLPASHLWPTRHLNVTPFARAAVADVNHAPNLANNDKFSKMVTARSSSSEQSVNVAEHHLKKLPGEVHKLEVYVGRSRPPQPTLQ